MKLKIVFVLTVIAVIIYFNACEEEGQKELILSGMLTGHSECKNSKSTFIDSGTPDTLSCINYSFDVSSNKLIMKHINSGFNCCPDVLYCFITLNGDTIIMEESEKEAMCNCDCLFDLDIEITGVKAKKYQVKFIEPYAGNQEAIEFEMDLASNFSGSLCVTRKQYPWGIYN